MSRRPLAILSLLLLAAGAAAVLHGGRDGRDPRLPRGVTDLTLDRRLDGVARGSAFRVEIEIDEPLFVAVWWFGEGGGAARLFPPLGAPRDLPWPLSPAEDGGRRRYLLPAPEGGLVLDRPGRGLIAVLSSPHALPEPSATLRAAARPGEVLARDGVPTFFVEVRE